MNARNNAAIEAVKAAACTNQAVGKRREDLETPIVGVEEAEAQPKPLNLHDLYLLQSDCDYHSAITLQACEVQSITRRMRGIRAITGILMAAADRDAFSLGDNLEFGLIDALFALATDADADLESANAKALKKVGAA